MSAAAPALVAVARDVEARGWACEEDFVEPGLCELILAEARDAHRHGRFHAASVGGGARSQVRSALRSDETCWLEAGASPAARLLWERIEQLRLTLNRELQLGLLDPEFHFARYAPGASYSRHLDQPLGSLQRVLSAVLYLNRAWHAEYGGALRLYLGAGASHDVLPQAGRLVVFLSARVEHEVLPATQERWSVAGWFRRRT